MTKDQQLKQLRKKAYLTYHQDGLIDIITGLAIIGFGLNIATEGSTFMVLAWLPAILYIPIKNQITVPRIGFARFESQRKTRNKLVLMFAIGVLNFFMLLALYLAVTRDALPQALIDWLDTYHMLLFGIGGAIIFSVLAAWSSIKRLYAYAILAIVIIYAGILLSINTALYIIILGAIPFFIGVAMLVRFLQTYPLVGQTETGDDS